MIRDLDVNRAIAPRVVEIQRAAYGREAELIAHDGIPPLHETEEDVLGRTDLVWRGAYADGQLVGVMAFTIGDDLAVVDRLAVHPAHARRGHGRRLVESLPRERRTLVSTGAANAPARALYESLGFICTGEGAAAPGLTIAEFERPAASDI